jgi:hypothetical protein
MKREKKNMPAGPGVLSLTVGTSQRYFTKILLHFNSFSELFNGKGNEVILVLPWILFKSPNHYLFSSASDSLGKVVHHAFFVGVYQMSFNIVI